MTTITGGRAVKLPESTIARMPVHLRALFERCQNPAKDEVVDAFPTSKDGIAGARTGQNGIAAAGLGAYEETWGGYGGEGSAARFFYTAKADAEDRMGSKHPTVKPVSLMRWLCTLITPPGGTVLDPFAGTGSTGLGAIGAGFKPILIEREEEYFSDIIRRFEWASGSGPLTAQATAKGPVDDPLDFGLFASQPASGIGVVGSTACSPTKVHRADRNEAVKS